MSELVRLHPDDCEAIARRVAELLGNEAAALAAPQRGRRLTAQEVAEQFGLRREWVYEHKAELGVIALGSGRRPRLRFDSERVAAALAASSATPAPVAVPAAAPRRRRRAAPAGTELLPIRGKRA